jgi:hypothetical protein
VGIETSREIIFFELSFLKGQPLEIFNFFGQWQLPNFDILDHRGDKGRKKQKEFTYLPSHLELHHNLAHVGYTESTCCCVQARFLGMETKILFALLWYMQYYLIMYLKPLALLKINILQKFSLLLLTFGYSPYHRGSGQNSSL